VDPSDTQVASEPKTPTLPPQIGPGPSPLWPKNLVDLFIRPRSFFSKRLALGHLPNLLLVTWCYGASNVISRIDTELIRAELGHARRGWETFSPFIVESWLGFWLWVLAMGAVGGAMIWWVGGWWYGVRVRWSGVTVLDKRLARLAFVYSSFVST